MITLANMHDGKHSSRRTCIYIGRPSMFGNPFVIGRDGTREEVIEKYRGWFEEKLLYDPKFHRAVLAIPDDAELDCFCAPQACHGGVIKEYLERVRS